MRAEWVSAASLVVALAALLYTRRNAHTSGRSLDVASIIGQVNYENARTAHTPAATLVLTQVEHRPPTARALDSILGVEARSWVNEHEADRLEVVARGTLINNCSHELLLTLHDHPRSRRTSWHPLRNESVFLLHGVDADLDRAVLPANAEVSFEWIDRRTRDEWIVIHGLRDASDSTSSPLVPRVSWRAHLRAIRTLRILDLLDDRTVARSGFYLVCESRASERVATIWHAEVVAAPVTISGWDDNTRRHIYADSLKTIDGPIDDDTIRYRVSFDPVLAQLHIPRLRYLRGRN